MIYQIHAHTHDAIHTHRIRIKVSQIRVRLTYHSLGISTRDLITTSYTPDNIINLPTSNRHNTIQTFINWVHTHSNPISFLIIAKELLSIASHRPSTRQITMELLLSMYLMLTFISNLKNKHRRQSGEYYEIPSE